MPAGNSGEFEFVYADSTYGTHKLRFKWAETVSGLTSTVSITEAAFWSNAYGGYDCLGYFVLEVNGQDLLTVDGQGSMRISLNKYVVMNVPALPVTTSAIAHNADGTKTITVRLKKLPSGGYVYPLMYCPPFGSGDVLYPAVTFKFTDNDSVSLTLSTVSVASDFTVTGDTMGSPIRIDINRSGSTLKHTLKWAFAGRSGTIASNVDTSYSWTPNANTFGGYIPTASSGSCTITCETYSGGTKVGETTKTFTLKIPSDAAPTVASGWSSLSYTNTGTAVNGCGACVKGYSILRWVLDVSKITLKYGATLASVKAVCGGTTLEKTASGTYSMGTAASVSNSMTVTVTDSRGKKTSGTFTRAATDYAAPGFSGAVAYRSDSAKQADESGTYITARAKAVVSAIGSGWNTATLTAAVKAAGGSYGTAETIPDNTLTLLSGSSYLITKSYVVKLTVTDRVGNSAMLEITVPTAEVAFNIRSGGKGAAFGKYAEYDNVLDIGDWNVFGRVLGLGRARASIPANADLNDYVDPGVYGVTTDASAASLANCPGDHAGTLRVWHGTGGSSNPGESWYYVVQEYDDIYGGSWRRSGQSGSGTTVTWGDWFSSLNSSDKRIGSGSDLDNYKTTGFYGITSGAANAPQNWTWLMVIGAAGGVVQVVFAQSKIMIRAYTGYPLAWTAWKSVSLS